MSRRVARLCCTGVLKVRHLCLMRTFLTIRLAGEATKSSSTHPMLHLYSNFQANRVVIVSSVIEKIFNPRQVLDGHISTFLNDSLILSVLIIIACCQLFIV